MTTLLLCGGIGLVTGGTAGVLLVVMSLSVGKAFCNTKGVDFKVSEGSKWGCASGACGGVITGCTVPLFGVGLLDSTAISSLAGGFCGILVASKVPTREETLEKHLCGDDVADNSSTIAVDE
eukprot:TRINITY_DN19031_c0_g1_i1.p1 TRINITY_DN19031_c0_g1~~TRINITY_DN19031_c0_g1_i1.p1  ORF type:complete len:122 (+),score=20.69 TRINITY_DN19031_c0_g1_i1:123-488(+)